MQPLFTHGPSINTRLLLLGVLSVLLLVVDARSQQLDTVRGWLSFVVQPIYSLAALPTTMQEGVGDYFATRGTLQIENEALEAKQLLTDARLLILQALEAENIRLRALLGSSFRLQAQVMVAELVTVDLDPFSQWVRIDKGEIDGVTVGQAVMDATGVMGQVVSVSLWQSTVVLLTDPSHGLPVQFNRHGLRAVATGQGLGQPLRLMHVPQNSDVQVGDTISTSGLGGLFPVGYPVGSVTAVDPRTGEAFISVSVSPLAQLATSRELLIVLRGDTIYSAPLRTATTTPSAAMTPASLQSTTVMVPAATGAEE